VLVLCTLIVVPRAHAENNCPWISEATASALLGGAATGAYTPAADGQPATCTFTRAEIGVTRQLHVTVEIVPAAAHMRVTALAGSCNSDIVPLPAIGNEATRCIAKVRGAAHAERVLGRVRNQVFTITLSTSQRDDGELTADILQTRIGIAAEQVSGNLF